jgi:predicted unusual protein kinase regulating ubiquinone biosynthesis (AarF/ABC1/UbiB family)
MYDELQQLIRSGKLLSKFGIEGAKFAISKSLGREDYVKTFNNFKDILGNAKGPIMKIAQILGTIPDLLPEDQAKIFRELQLSAPPMGAFFVKRRMKAELGEGWESKFKSFNQTAHFSASLGQVHKAVTLTGETVACKLQYPDMINAIESDISQLKLFLKGIRFLYASLDTSALVEEITQRLREEVDYKAEAGMMLKFKEIFEIFPNVSVPTPVLELSTDKLLTMNWLEGKSILWAEKQDLDFRQNLADLIFNVWYYPFYKEGLIHADPHFGNFAVTDEGGLHVFDFGCVQKFEKHFVQSVLMLFKGLLKKDNELCFEAYKAWGFEGIEKETVGILNLWANLVYGPLLEDRVRPLQEDHSGVTGRETLFFILDFCIFPPFIEHGIYEFAACLLFNGSGITFGFTVLGITLLVNPLPE